MKSAHKRMTALGLAAGVAIASASIAIADDWPGWRGPTSDGVWKETGIIEKFPEGGLKPLWSKPVGMGYAGPAVAAGRVFVTDLIEGERNAGTERLQVFDAKNGDLLWKQEWPIDRTGLMAPYGTGVRATPLVDGERVYIQGVKGNLMCFNVADGAIVWQKDFIKEYEAFLAAWGWIGAPLVEGDKIIALVGGKDSTVMAFDKATGKEIWKAIPMVSETGYAPISVVEAGGVRQIIAYTPDAIVSLNAADGAIYWSHPYKANLAQTINAPVHYEDKLIFSSGSHGTTVMKLAADKPAMEILWEDEFNKDKNPGLRSFMSAPWVEDGYIYGTTVLGPFVCVDLKDGKEVWRNETITPNFRLSTVHVVKNGDRHILYNDQGELIFGKLTPQGFNEIDRTLLIKPDDGPGGKRYPRPSGVVNWAHPAYSNGMVFQRNFTELICVSLKADGAAAPAAAGAVPAPSAAPATAAAGTVPAPSAAVAPAPAPETAPKP